jgi:hypothetical protein
MTDTTKNSIDEIDVKAVIDANNSDNWFDPTGYERECWAAELLNPEGKRLSEGVGLSAREAAAYAWINFWDPGALVESCVTADDMPNEPDDAWHFKLHAPGTWGQELREHHVHP